MGGNATETLEDMVMCPQGDFPSYEGQTQRAQSWAVISIEFEGGHAGEAMG